MVGLSGTPAKGPNPVTIQDIIVSLSPDVRLVYFLNSLSLYIYRNDANSKEMECRLVYLLHRCCYKTVKPCRCCVAVHLEVVSVLNTFHLQTYRRKTDKVNHHNERSVVRTHHQQQQIITTTTTTNNNNNDQCVQETTYNAQYIYKNNLLHLFYHATPYESRTILRQQS